MRPRMKAWLCVAALALVLVAIMGCTQGDIAEVQANVVVLKQNLATLQEQQESVDALLVALPEGDTKVKALAIREEVVQRIAQAQAALTLFEERLTSAKDTLDLVVAGGEATAPFLPPPYNTIALILLGAIPFMIRAWRVKATAIKVIKGVDPYVVIPPEKVAEVQAAQGGAGNALVDQAQGKATGLPI